MVAGEGAATAGWNESGRSGSGAERRQLKERADEELGTGMCVVEGAARPELRGSQIRQL